MQKLLIASVILFCVALLAGCLGFFNAMQFGAGSLEEYRFVMTTPFFGGFILIGFFGLLYVYRNRASNQCLYGFAIVLFCYGGIEVIFKAVGGI